MKHALLVLVLVLALIGLAVGGIGEVLSKPSDHLIGPAPADLMATQVTLRTRPDEVVSGWFIPGKPARGAVLLLHGVRADRRQMIDRARFLSGDGYSVLLSAAFLCRYFFGTFRCDWAYHRNNFVRSPNSRHCTLRS